MVDETTPLDPPSAKPASTGAEPIPLPVNGGIQTRQAPKTAFTGAARYSRFVMIMKLVLPLTAFAIVALTVFLGTSYETDDEFTLTFSASPVPQDDRRMIRPTFTGTSRDGRHFEVTAQSAERDPETPSQVMLETLSATSEAENEPDFSLLAERGRLDTDEQIVTLFGDVTVESNTGYTFRMDRVSIDMDNQSASSETPVEGSGPMGDVTARRMAITPGWTSVVFSGDVRVLLKPDRVGDLPSAP